MKLRLSVAVAAVLALALAPGLAGGSPRMVDAGEGVRFDLPPGLVENENVLPPVLRAWNGASDPVFVLVVAVQAPNANEDMLKELQDWPQAGRNMGSGFGDALSGGLGRQLGVACSYTRTPIAVDRGRFLGEVAVEVTCETSPETTTFRVLVLFVLTRTSQVVIQVNAAKGAYPVGERIASTIWGSLEVAPEHRLGAGPPDSRPESVPGERSGKK